MADPTVPPDLASILASGHSCTSAIDIHGHNEQNHQSIGEVHLIFAADTSATPSARTLLKPWLIRTSVSTISLAMFPSSFRSTYAATARSQ